MEPPLSMYKLLLNLLEYLIFIGTIIL